MAPLAEPGQQLRVKAVQNLHGDGDGFPALGGETDDLGPPVGGVGDALDVAGHLQVANQLAHGLLGDLRGNRHVDHPGAVLSDVLEDLGMGGPNGVVPTGRQPLDDGAVHCPVAVIQKVGQSSRHLDRHPCYWAFADDPLMRWFVGDTHRYPGFFAQSLRHLAFPADGAWTTEGGEAVAIWLAPEQANPSIARQLAMLPSLLGTCRGRTARVLRTLAITGRHHPPEPAWYLLGLGAATPGRGHGLRPASTSL